MNSAPHKLSVSYWQLPALWGLDVALCALCWGVLVAAHYGITMITTGPLLVLSSTVWLVVMAGRLTKACGGQKMMSADFYRRNLVPLLPLFLAVLGATWWMLFFRVGQYLLYFGLIPFLMLGVSRFPLLYRIPGFSLFFKSAAFAFACAVPTFYYSFYLSPLQMWQSTPLWMLAGLFFLFHVERGRAASGMGGVQVFCLAAVFGFSMFRMIHAPAGVSSWYLILCMAVAGLHMLFRLRTRLSEEAWYALGWPVMTVPALLGIVAFAPEAW